MSISPPTHSGYPPLLLTSHPPTVLPLAHRPRLCLPVCGPAAAGKDSGRAAGPGVSPEPSRPRAPSARLTRCLSSLSRSLCPDGYRHRSHPPACPQLTREGLAPALTQRRPARGAGGAQTGRWVQGWGTHGWRRPFPPPPSTPTERQGSASQLCQSSGPSAPRHDPRLLERVPSPLPLGSPRSPKQRLRMGFCVSTGTVWTGERSLRNKGLK